MGLLPRLPRPKLPPNPIKPLRDLLHEGMAQIHEAEDDIRSLTTELKGKESERPAWPSGTIPAHPEMAPESGTEMEGTVSEEATLKYQLERILDDIQHLETEHLPAKGRIASLACDCISKAARDLRRHLLETIPIASRQGKDAVIFSEMVPVAQHLIDIGTMVAVKSGQYDNEYLEMAGVMSNYRKKITQLIAECETCGKMEDLATFIRERRKQSGS